MPPAGDLADQADDAGRIGFPVHDDDVTDLAEPVAGGVEDGAPLQARDEHPLRTHAPSVAPASRLAPVMRGRE